MRFANYVGLSLHVATFLCLGALARSRPQAIGLGLIELAVRSGQPLLVDVTTLVAAIAGRLAGERRSRQVAREGEPPAEAVAPVSRFARAVSVVTSVLELRAKNWKRALFSAIVLLPCFCLVEVAARARLRALDRAALRARMKDYYDIDENNVRLWRPRPNYSAELTELAGLLRGAGHTEGERVIRDLIEKGIVPRDARLHLNSLGFKGEDFPLAKPAGEERIVCIGDSCTFGLAGTSYSRAAEQALAAVDSSRAIRVVNGGVEGYSAAELALRVPEYVALSPDLVFIYIGWNSLYSSYEDPLRPASEKTVERYIGIAVTPPSPLRLDTLRLLDRLRYGLPRSDALADDVTKRWEPVSVVPAYRPRFSLRALDELLRRLERAGVPASRIAIATLPGILRADKGPSPAALKLAKLPAWTEGNAYVLALACERYNEQIRELARRDGLRLVDLEQWERSLDAPAEEVFFDAIHMNLAYQILLGEHLAPIFREALASSRR